ncbi:hypothetical protein EPI10_028926 [Gossypium australe]|uniref:Uncharacterized protein n=1 Tax=Gossypium australe TaxID=47621 RepID=A0A5B6UX87_9ROSI|nr:hypothetical protein EPI10_028926 [Gossypium australe]
MPVWIQCYRVLLELFTQKGLSYIASAIGTPLYMDSVTVSQTRLSYAKICVEISIDTVIPLSINVKLSDGSLTSITVMVSCLLVVLLVTPFKDKVWLPKKSVDQVVEDSVFDTITTDSVVADSIVAHEESGKGKAVVISPSPPPKKQVHFSSSSNWFEVLGSKLSNLPVLLDATDAESTTASHLGCGIVIIIVKG